MKNIFLSQHWTPDSSRLWLASFCRDALPIFVQNRWLKYRSTIEDHLVQLPLLKQGHLELVEQDHGQKTLQYIHKLRFHNLPGQPVQVICHILSKVFLSHCLATYMVKK